MKKYNYFDDNDVDNSIYDREDDIYNIARAIRERIANQDKKPSDVEEAEKEEIIKENSKLTLADLKQKIRDGELLRNISFTNIRNSLSFKDTRMRVALPVVIILLLSIGIGSLCYQITSSNKKISEFSQVAGQVCTQKIAEYGFCSFEPLNEKYGENVNKLVGVCFARELDFDNDGKSELLIAYNDGGIYFNEIYGFNKHKEFVSLFKKQVCTVEDATHGNFITLYRDNNKYYIGSNEEVEGDESAKQSEENSNVQRIDLYALGSKGFKKKQTYDYDYINEAFSKKGKVNLTDFEKIKLSSIKNAESERKVAQVSKVINSFDTSSAGITVPTDTTNRMYQEYFRLVKDYNAKYGSAKIVEEDGESAINGLAVVKLIDFDGDATDELMLIYRKEISRRSTDKKGNYISLSRNEYLCEIYKWTGEKAIRIFRNDCISSRVPNGIDSFYIIKHDGDESYYCENDNSSSEKGNVVISSSKIYVMDNLNFVKDFELVKEHRWGHDTFYADGDRIRKREFYDRQGNVPLFLTEDDTYDNKTFEIGYVKRKSENKQDVETQLKQTIAEIQKLNKQYVHE